MVPKLAASESFGHWVQMQILTPYSKPTEFGNYMMGPKCLKDQQALYVFLIYLEMEELMASEVDKTPRIGHLLFMPAQKEDARGCHC